MSTTKKHQPHHSLLFKWPLISNSRRVVLNTVLYLLPPPSPVTGQDRSPAAAFHIIRRAGPPVSRGRGRLTRSRTLLRPLNGTSAASHAHCPVPHPASSFAAFDCALSCHHLLVSLRSSLCLGKDMPHGPHFCVTQVSPRQRNLPPHAGVSRGDVLWLENCVPLSRLHISSVRGFLTRKIRNEACQHFLFVP